MTTKWVRPWSVMTCAIAGSVKSLKKFSRSTRTAAVLKPSSLAAFCRPTRFVPVGSHHIPQAGDGDFLFVMEAHHCERSGRAVRRIVLPHIGITHTMFPLQETDNQKQTISFSMYCVYFKTTAFILAHPVCLHKPQFAVVLTVGLTNEKGFLFALQFNSA